MLKHKDLIKEALKHRDLIKEALKHKDLIKEAVKHKSLSGARLILLDFCHRVGMLRSPGWNFLHWAVCVNHTSIAIMGVPIEDPSRISLSAEYYRDV